MKLGGGRIACGRGSPGPSSEEGEGRWVSLPGMDSEKGKVKVPWSFVRSEDEFPGRISMEPEEGVEVQRVLEEERKQISSVIGVRPETCACGR
jgi:hypothetical protein